MAENTHVAYFNHEIRRDRHEFSAFSIELRLHKEQQESRFTPLKAAKLGLFHFNRSLLKSANVYRHLLLGENIVIAPYLFKPTFLVTRLSVLQSCICFRQRIAHTADF